MLYMSPDEDNKICAIESIQDLLVSIPLLLPHTVYSQFLPVVLLELCKLLRRVAGYDDYCLYKLCRNSLGVVVKDSKAMNIFHGGDDNRVMIIALQDLFPFVAELASELSRGLVSSMESVSKFGPSTSDVKDFRAFLKPLKAAVVKYQVILPLSNCIFTCEDNGIRFLYVIFDDLLTTLVMCLKAIEGLVIEKKENGGWDQYLVILKELHDISKLYQGGEEYFRTNLKDFKRLLCHLIVRYAKRGKDYGWILDQKDDINFEARRHLVMLLSPMDEYDDIHEMFIDRSRLLTESFEYVANEEPKRLRGELIMEFKDEEATGRGVLREWFFLLSQEIFNPKTGLFVACPNDPRRSFPNPSSNVDRLHVEYYRLAGRVIALALMNKIQVGIVFDRSFFLQLAGKNVSLEDIKDADPLLYSSCRQILDMDPSAVDQDALGLTFVWDINESGSIKVAELCPGGKDMIVNSSNRKAYVDLLIHHRFVASVAEKISHFARGFTDIIGGEKNLKMFFGSLALEDFDRILHGNESDICVVDWKAHTDYQGYLQNDPQIYWFWKVCVCKISTFFFFLMHQTIQQLPNNLSFFNSGVVRVVEEMTVKQRKALLFFWTSMKYLPVEGFGGLTPRLYIHKSNESIDHLPSSHTCFYQILLPVYPSMAVMKNRLSFITQDHVGCSYGIS
ncbi:hypothetical protein L6452_14642 [Arctium lappa]|uniref:Uncharacterized protein n=1 Tax=Arctium lappa TaxID=4217 RepID=A0ACB9CLL4_ARCLA|nr:hypothetical protein L6452_14642 [Arctium lappa]